MRQNDSHGNPRPLRGITRSCATTFLRSSMLRRFDSHTSSPQQHVVVINTNMTTATQTASGFLLPYVQNTRTKKDILFILHVSHITIRQYASAFASSLEFGRRVSSFLKQKGEAHDTLSGMSCTLQSRERSLPALPVPLFISCGFLTEPS